MRSFSYIKNISHSLKFAFQKVLKKISYNFLKQKIKCNTDLFNVKLAILYEVKLNKITKRN